MITLICIVAVLVVVKIIFWPLLLVVATAGDIGLAVSESWEWQDAEGRAECLRALFWWWQFCIWLVLVPWFGLMATLIVYGRVWGW